MSIRVLQFQHTFDVQQWEAMKHHGIEDRQTDDVARRAIANMMVPDHVLRKTIIEPDPSDPFGGMRAFVRYAVGVADKSDAAGLEAQLAEARADGFRLAADEASRRADRFVGAQGLCGGVIASELGVLSKRLHEMAKEAAKPLVAVP